MDNQTIVYAFVAFGIVFNAIMGAVFYVTAKVKNTNAITDAIFNIAYAIDEFADNAEIPQKRAALISDIGAVLGWRKVLIPNALIGWVLDAEIKAIRKIQGATNCPNLHDESEEKHDEKSGY